MRNHLSRQRGVILTPTGFQKLHHAKINRELQQNIRCTLEYLTQHTGLTANTLSKIFTSSVAVDKRSLLSCFAAFNLALDHQDYDHLLENSQQRRMSIH